MEKEIVIKNNFSIETYTKALLNVMLPKPMLFVVIVLFSIFFISAVRNVITDAQLGNFTLDSLLKTQILILLLPLVYYLLLTQSLKARSRANPQNIENVYHILTPDFFQVKGDSFDTKYYWKDLSKLKEVKDFFLIFVEKNHFLIINKSDLKANQYQELKQLFNSIEIKKSLLS